MDEQKDDETPIECECCGFDTPVGGVKDYSGRFDSEGKRVPQWLCVLCASTSASTYHEYHKEGADLLATVCYVGNQIRRDLAK